MKVYIGIDNGTSGTLGILSDSLKIFIETPSKIELSYTKTKQNISRVDFDKFYSLLKSIVEEYGAENCLAVLERPLVNPGRFKTTMSAMRCLESQLIALEKFNIAYKYVDSKEWQKELLPSGIKGSSELKKASVDIGIRLFPSFKDLIIKHGDADGILIAEYARRKNF